MLQKPSRKESDNLILEQRLTPAQQIIDLLMTIKKGITD